MEINNNKILYGVLNWGIGHATRSIPLIHKLIANNNKLIIASSGESLTLLKTEFSDADFVELPDYGITYGSGNLVFEAMKQYARVNKIIKEENKFIEDIVENKGANLIISDNRYGVYHPEVKSVLLTHQLRLKLPKAFAFLGPAAQRVNSGYILKFDEIWVPDFEDENNLSGDLSHGVNPGVPVKFIGPLSRFSGSETVYKKRNYKYDIAFILSGPEPARTVFENLIGKQLEEFDGKAVMVRGKPSNLIVPEYNNCDVFNFQNHNELYNIISSTDLIVCRSGYSTIMDLFFLKKKALLIPTPGQSEQLYLAEYHKEKGNHFFINQRKFDLSKSVGGFKV